MKQVINNLWDLLLQENPSNVCNRASVEFDDRRSVYTVVFLNDKYFISLNERSISGIGEEHLAEVPEFHLLVLYYLIQGKHPFGTGLKAIPNILKAEAPNFDLPYLNKPIFRPITNEIWGIINRCLQLKPELRPTADQLITLCENLCYTSEGRSVGAIIQFKPGNGDWGFIRKINGAKVFFHGQNYCGDSPEITGRVNFSDYVGEPFARACPILPIKP